MIKNRSEMEARGYPYEIDLKGPDGNAVRLIGLARSLGKTYGYDPSKITVVVEEMMSGDYENLVEIFDAHYGDLVTLYR